MVGWVGGDTRVADLFAKLPELQRIYGWDAETQRSWQTSRTSTGQGLEQLTAGQGLWLEILGDTVIGLVHEVADDYVLLSLREGANLVGWTGEDGIPIEEAVGRFGEALLYTYRWDAQAQRFDLFYPGGGEFNTLVELNRGDALWVGLAEEARWWQSGTAGTQFAFDQGVSPEREVEVRTALARAIGFFAEQYGVEPPEFSIEVSESATSFTLAFSMDRPPSSWSWGSGFVGTGSNPTGDALESRLVREYFQVLQRHLSGHPYLHPPAWMADGAAKFAAGVYGVSVQGLSGESIRQGWLESSTRIRGSLSAYEARNFGWASEVSPSALDWLVDHAVGKGSDGALATSREPLDRGGLAGSDAHLQYLRLLPSSATWQEAFETAFGISPEDFYREFELYRERFRFNQVSERLFGLDPEEFSEDFAPYHEAVTTPLGHRGDDAVKPVLVFLGDVPSTTRTKIQAEMDSVYSFLANHLGADPIDYSVYVAADDAAARPTYYGLYRQGVIGGAFHCSFSNSHDVTFHVLTCGRYSLDYREYLRGFFGVLRSRTQTGPSWLHLGIYEYAAARYAETIERGSFGAVFRHFVASTQRNPATLKQIETHQGWHAAGNDGSWALAFVAIERLARQAGELALIEYFRLLPRGEPDDGPDYEEGAGSWQAAFEQAFGLTIDEFYEQFAEYRAGPSLR